MTLQLTAFTEFAMDRVYMRALSPFPIMRFMPFHDRAGRTIDAARCSVQFSPGLPPVECTERFQASAGVCYAMRCSAARKRSRTLVRMRCGEL